jgi:peptide/nickel transport system substrate-binding protein
MNRVADLPRLLVAVVSTLSLAVLTACTGGGPDAPTNAPSPSGPAATSINVQPRNVLADGGELRLPVGSFGDQWNPLHADADQPSTQLIISTLMPQLFHYDESGNPSPNPDYLAGVHASGEDPQVVTYTLNPNASWGGGRKMDAGDFIANWEACNGQNVSFECAETERFAEVASVKEGTSPQQVIVTYNGIYDDWPETFAFLLPKEGVTDPKIFNDGWNSITEIEDWVGGPFEVSDFDERDGVLIEQPNPDWWAEQPKLAQLTFRRVAERDQVTALEEHRIDVADISDDSDEVATVNKLGDCEVRVAVVPGGERQLVATRRSLANYGAFGKSTITWTNVGYLAPGP